MANGRCHLHGGKSLAGVAHPNFKHGRYSKYLDGEILASYAASLTDPDLLSLRDEIALIDARTAELLGGLESGEGRGLWVELQRVNSSLAKARANKDWDAMAAAFTEMGSLIERGARKGVIWDEVVCLAERRRRLTDSEAKRWLAMRYVVAVDTVMVRIRALVEILRARINDPSLLNEIMADFRRIIGGGKSAGSADFGDVGRGGGRVRQREGTSPPVTVDTAVSRHSG